MSKGRNEGKRRGDISADLVHQLRLLPSNDLSFFQVLLFRMNYQCLLFTTCWVETFHVQGTCAEGYYCEQGMEPFVGFEMQKASLHRDRPSFSALQQRALSNLHSSALLWIYEYPGHWSLWIARTAFLRTKGLCGMYIEAHAFSLDSRLQALCMAGIIYSRFFEENDMNCMYRHIHKQNESFQSLILISCVKKETMQGTE